MARLPTGSVVLNSPLRLLCPGAATVRVHPAVFDGGRAGESGLEFTWTPFGVESIQTRILQMTVTEGGKSVADADVDPNELRELLAMVPALVILVDPDRTIRFINRVGTGHEGSEVIGIDMLEFLYEEHRAQQAEMFDRVLETMEPGSFDIPIPDAEGNERWYEGTMTPLVRGERVAGVVVMTRDVTGRRRAEQEAATLRDLVPLCSWCNKVRDDEGYWQALESYIEKDRDSHVTHGICPDCEREVLDQKEDGA